MNVIQISVAENGVFGLGSDNKVYRWDYQNCVWEPHWNQNPGAQASVYIPD